MPFETPLTQHFGLTLPVIQAPMAGVGDTPELVAAVSNAGGIGFIGAAYLTPQQIAEAAQSIRAKTSRPFGINLFAPTPEPKLPDHAEEAVTRVAPFFEELGLPSPEIPQWKGDPFDAQLTATLDSGAAAFSFTFGTLPEATLKAIKSRGLFIAGTATTIEEAALLERAGVDAVIAQGSEAGGHRGTFAADPKSAMIGTISLVPQVVDA